jgi:hypothetical protein
MQRLIDAEAFVLEFIHDQIFSDGTGRCKVLVGVRFYKKVSIIVIH